MNDTQEALIQRLRALIEQKPADLAGDVARIAFDANERIEVSDSEVVAVLGGERVALPIPKPEPDPVTELPEGAEEIVQFAIIPDDTASAIEPETQSENTQ